MFESMVCEHMPKTATARNKAFNWNKGGMLAKKFLFSQENGSVRRPETENFLVRPYLNVFFFFWFSLNAFQFGSQSLPEYICRVLPFRKQSSRDIADLQKEAVDAIFLDNFYLWLVPFDLVNDKAEERRNTARWTAETVGSVWNSVLAYQFLSPSSHVCSVDDCAFKYVFAGPLEWPLMLQHFFLLYKYEIPPQNASVVADHWHNRQGKAIWCHEKQLPFPPKEKHNFGWEHQDHFGYVQQNFLCVDTSIGFFLGG